VIPDNLRYTSDHEWVAPDASPVRVGITHYAQDALGDIVYVDLPAVGASIEAGQSFGEVESTKSVSDLFSPLDGEVVARNENLDSQPELVNAEPYGDGWMIELRVADAAAVDGLLDAQAYQKLTEQG